MSSLRTVLKRYPTLVATVCAILLLGTLALFIHVQVGSRPSAVIDDQLSGSTVGSISATTAASSLIEAPDTVDGLPPSIATVIADPAGVQQSHLLATATARTIALPVDESPAQIVLRNEFRPRWEYSQPLEPGGRLLEPRVITRQASP